MQYLTTVYACLWLIRMVISRHNIMPYFQQGRSRGQKLASARGQFAGQLFGRAPPTGRAASLSGLYSVSSHPYRKRDPNETNLADAWFEPHICKWSHRAKHPLVLREMTAKTQKKKIMNRVRVNEQVKRNWGVLKEANCFFEVSVSLRKVSAHWDTACPTERKSVWVEWCSLTLEHTLH